MIPTGTTWLPPHEGGDATRRNGGKSLRRRGWECGGVDTGLESRRFCPQGRKGSSETHCTWIGEGLKGSMGPSPWLGVSVVESLEHWLGKSIHPFRGSLKSFPPRDFIHSFIQCFCSGCPGTHLCRSLGAVMTEAGSASWSSGAEAEAEASARRETPAFSGEVGRKSCS